MDTPLIVSLVGLFGTVLVAAFTYLLTKRREREAEWRKEKLAYYKAFVESISGVVTGDVTPDGNRLFARTTNNLLLFASQAVIDAVTAFRLEARTSNPNPSLERHDALFSAMLLAIRRDVGVTPPDDISTFKPRLWSSGLDEAE